MPVGILRQTGKSVCCPLAQVGQSAQFDKKRYNVLARFSTVVQSGKASLRLNCMGTVCCGAC